MLIRKTVTLDRFEGRFAVLKLENGHELTLPKDDFALVPEGTVLVLEVLPEPEATLKKEDLARTLLNQILQDDSHAKSHLAPSGS